MTEEQIDELVFDASPDGTGIWCATCRRGLVAWAPEGSSRREWRHSLEEIWPADHPVRPVDIRTLDDPIIECDFCSATPITVEYECANQVWRERRTTRRTMSIGEYTDRHTAGVVGKHTTEATGRAQQWGEHWVACAECAALVDARDINGLVARVVDTFPPKLRNTSKKLISVRANLRDTYEHVLTTISRRGRVVFQPRLGVIWDRQS